jgi:predicted dehydrogenase
MRKLGLGVLGLGEGRSIISAGLNSPLWQVAALCDLNEQMGRQRCAEFGLNNFTTSYDELLCNEAVDVVGIYTPDHLHADHVLKALQAGKHVICTKPFLDNLTRARELLETSRRSGKRVFVGQSSRFFASFARQRKHYESGAFGELITVEASYHADHRWFLGKQWARLDSFKWLYGCISHPADFVRWYLPDIVEVIGYASLSANGRAAGLVHPDTFHFILKAANGTIARVSGSYSGPVVPCQRDSGMTCILRCANGASQGDYHELRYSWRIGEQAVVETFEDEEDYYFRFGGRTHHAGEYQNYIEYFARCLESGETPKPDITDGIITVALLQAMEETAATGRAIRIADVLAKHGLAELLSPA